MRLPGTFNPDQLALMRQVLEHYCSTHGIDSPLEREDVARRLLSRCHSGLSTTEGLLKVLEKGWRPTASA